MSLSPDRMARLMALFEEALDLEPLDRAPWLSETCADDPEVRDEVMALLEMHERTGGVLDRPPPEVAPAAPLGPRVRAALADRYAIEAELGRGGMAIVFRAQERKHERPVVIKVLLPEVAAAFGPARFQDEVRIAARLSHPHILGLIDSGEADGLLYYVMPHVQGQTLRERLRREGALPAGAAITLLRDIAGALAHAHAAGVVHRDLKPDNVLCVGDHAFLLDFGIAKLEAEVGVRRTDPAFPLGTPGYMSPEQAAGRVVDHRTDLYAWGLLGRELLTGYPDPVPDLVARRPDAPAELARLVERCLQPAPEDRVQAAGELVERLDALVAPVPGRRAAAPRRRRRLWPAGVMLAGVAGTWLALRPRPALDEPVPMPVAATVLRNETADSTLAVWGRMAGDWITQGLHETGLFQVVPWPSVLHATERWAAARTPGPGPELGTVVQEETGARTIVTGAYYLAGSDLRFQVEIVDARSGSLLAALPPVVVPRDSAPVAIQSLRDRVMGTLAVRSSERVGELPGLAERPPTYEAYRIFDRGLQLYNAQEYRAAIAEFRRAALLDSTFLAPVLHAAFGTANTGQSALMDTLLSQLGARRAELNEYEERQRQYLAALKEGDAARALVAIREAARMGPGTRAGYNAALTALTLNRPAEALADLQALDAERGLLRGWSSYWTQLAHALHLLGHHEEELRAAREARVRYPDRRVNQGLEARALASLGRTAEVDSILEASRTLPADTYWSQGAVMVLAGEELMAHGREPEGTEWLRRAVAWLEPRAARPEAPPGHRYWLGMALYHLGRDAEARRVFEAQLRDAPGELQNRGLAALALARTGNREAALRVLGEATASERGSHSAYRARIAAILGDHDRALSLLAEALGHGVDGWAWVHTSAWRDFAPLRGDPRYEQLMRGDR